MFITCCQRSIALFRVPCHMMHGFLFMALSAELLYWDWPQSVVFTLAYTKYPVHREEEWWDFLMFLSSPFVSIGFWFVSQFWLWGRVASAFVVCLAHQEVFGYGHHWFLLVLPRAVVTFQRLCKRGLGFNPIIVLSYQNIVIDIILCNFFFISWPALIAISQGCVKAQEVGRNRAGEGWGRLGHWRGEWDLW